jgi:hypothetical protein
MKSRIVLIILLLQTSLAFSQEKLLPEIKKGVSLSYQVSANGQLFPILMKFDSLSSDYNRISWSMPDGSGGNIINTKVSLDNATKGYWGQLQNGGDLTLPSDQTVLVLSKTLWAAIQKDKKFTFDDLQFTVKEQPADAIFKLKDKALNVVYAESSNAAVRVWILNSPTVPILVKIEGNPIGIDIFLESID